MSILITFFAAHVAARTFVAPTMTADGLAAQVLLGAWRLVSVIAAHGNVAAHSLLL